MKIDSGEHKSAHISLRPVQLEDTPFLLEVYGSTRASEMALVPWSDEQRQAFLSSQFAAQKDFYTQKYSEAEHSIILTRGQPVGRLFLARLDHHLHIVDLTLLPEAQSAGIEDYLLKELQDEACRSHKPIRIYIENFNPSVALFARLGFKLIEEQGVHVLLQWSPAAPGELHAEPPKRDSGF